MDSEAKNWPIGKTKPKYGQLGTERNRDISNEIRDVTYLRLWDSIKHDIKTDIKTIWIVVRQSRQSGASDSQDSQGLGSRICGMVLLKRTAKEEN